MKNLSYIKLSIALVSMFGMSLTMQAMNRKEEMQAKYAPMKEEHNKKMKIWNAYKNKQEEEKKSLLNHGSSASYNSFSINGHPDDINKIKKTMQVRGDKIDNVAEKTKTLRKSSDEFKRATKEIKSIPIASKTVNTTVLFTVNSSSNESPAPTSPINTVTADDTTETKPFIKEKEVKQAGCLITFFCCDYCDEEEN